MHSVELLEQTLQWAQRHGYQIRHEYLGGTGGGCCQVGHRRMLFVDLALGAEEQLQYAVEALQAEGVWDDSALPAPLRPLSHRRRAA